MLSKDLFLLGIQGCGKGTQATLLLNKLSEYLYFEMGETLRSLHTNSNLIGNYMKDCMNRGEMVDNFITNDLMDISLKIAQKNNKHLMIDGYPRVGEQTEYLLPRMEELKRDFAVIHYYLPREKAIERLLKRAEIEGRKDDNLKSIETRIGIFTNETLVQIEKFESLGKVITINADNTIEGIFQETCEKLGI
ncbi:MAG: nucleoside monophosphate kinase [Candidatus Absconditicoccaceae bacterium]